MFSSNNPYANFMARSPCRPMSDPNLHSYYSPQSRCKDNSQFFLSPQSNWQNRHSSINCKNSYSNANFTNQFQSPPRDKFNNSQSNNNGFHSPNEFKNYPFYDQRNSPNPFQNQGNSFISQNQQYGYSGVGNSWANNSPTKQIPNQQVMMKNMQGLKEYLVNQTVNSPNKENLKLGKIQNENLKGQKNSNPDVNQLKQRLNEIQNLQINKRNEQFIPTKSSIGRQAFSKKENITQKIQEINKCSNFQPQKGRNLFNSEMLNSIMRGNKPKSEMKTKSSENFNNVMNSMISPKIGQVNINKTQLTQPANSSLFSNTNDATNKSSGGYKFNGKMKDYFNSVKSSIQKRKDEIAKTQNLINSAFENVISRSMAYTSSQSETQFIKIETQSNVFKEKLNTEPNPKSKFNENCNSKSQLNKNVHLFINIENMFKGICKSEITNYVGDIIDGIRMGKGRASGLLNEYSYSGNWNNNQFHGFGVLMDQNNRPIYEGNWESGIPNGKGNLYNIRCSDQTRVESRNFSFLPDSWISFEGEFLDGKINGKGLIKFLTGERFLGHFENNIPNGEGRFIVSENEIVLGNWNNGYLSEVI